jgi:hypothetical protein
LREGGIDRSRIEWRLPAHHAYDREGVFVIRFHQVLARGHRILLGDDGADTETDRQSGEDGANEHRVSLSVVQTTVPRKTLAPRGYSSTD